MPHYIMNHISDYLRAQGWEWVPHGYKPPNNPDITVYPEAEKIGIYSPVAPTYHINYADPTLFDQLQALNK